MCAAACRVTHAFQWGNSISDAGASLFDLALKTNPSLNRLDLVSAGGEDVRGVWFGSIQGW